MAVNLREYRTELHLESSYYDKLAHSIADRALFQVQVVHRQVVERLVYARGTLFEHLHLLVTKCHIVEHNEQMELIPAARFKIDHIHYTVGFLQQVERSFVLLSLDEPICTIIQFS